ncbi:MAG: hypothetical protein VKO01_08275 [Cyanobacteriota bacterium]|nr:hypothetical protein [Cyanobacteriota bacterium]
MDSIQAQVVVLTDKVDALHQMIDQINAQISIILATAQEASGEVSHLVPTGQDQGQFYGQSLLDAVCEHKDVLVDSAYMSLDRHPHQANFSQDIQIQRLTAQLTAAYNRIAALEEQLLAARAHL